MHLKRAYRTSRRILSCWGNKDVEFRRQLKMLRLRSMPCVAVLVSVATDQCLPCSFSDGPI